MKMINEVLDATARGDITLDQAEAICRERGWARSIQGFTVWEWPGHADLARINEDVLWPLQKRLRVDLAPVPKYAPALDSPRFHRFTCHVCGEHRDTTLRGHCDDCEA